MAGLPLRDVAQAYQNLTPNSHQLASMDRIVGNMGAGSWENITRSIIGCAFSVSNELGSGFLESVYEKAMLVALNGQSIAVQAQAPINVYFRQEVVGVFFADLLVEGRVIVELKAVKALSPEHQAQVINYLQATGIEVGLLLNFGRPRLEYKRLTRTRP